MSRPSNVTSQVKVSSQHIKMWDSVYKSCYTVRNYSGLPKPSSLNYETVLDQFCCFVDDDDGDGAPSKLMCHYFRSSDMNKEWSIEMAKDEEILAIACGQGWVRTLSSLLVQWGFE